MPDAEHAKQSGAAGHGAAWIVSERRPAPYPADTRSKGWRFELNMEQVKKSDTWLRARTGRVRASLLLLWAEAWEQTPCGSLPNDEELLCLLLDMEPDEFSKARPVLMRGWWLGEDGRLYHDTITERVLDMLKARAGNAKRVANHKQAKREQREGNALPTQQSPVSNDTGTGTSTGKETDAFESVFRAHAQDTQPHDPEDGEFTHCEPSAGPDPPSRYGAISRVLRQAGISNAQPALMRFRLLVDAGADAAEFLAFVPKALGIQGDRFAYICGSVEGERKRAIATAGQLHVGAMPLNAKAAENAKWIAGTSLDRSAKRNVIDMEAEHAAPLVLGR